MTLKDHLQEYKRDGYTVFPGYLPPEQVREWRSRMDPEFEQLFPKRPDAPRARIVPLLGHELLAPLAKVHVSNSLMLDFAEKVMGPYVQLDSFEVSGFPVREQGLKGAIDRWHRDAFNNTETWSTFNTMREQSPRTYTPPLACNCLTYLQDMNEETGPLRVIKGSHLDYTFIDKEDERKPHSRESLLDLKAGDMVFTHHEILHSGTWNISKEIRYFLSVYVCRVGFPHRDTFDLTAIHELMSDARERHDRRLLRLFGEDDQFMVRLEESWKRMVGEDRSAITE
ncbi:MAG: phytanoyl-CoA dioxygenase family protein [Candidatus Latescibacterota bacterium]|nr:phytanoyl-CoA dioxygenase family protein [Candidatus Latescibacterota bacterium]